MLRVGVLGGGFIARTHLRSWTRIGVETHLYARRGSEQLALDFSVTTHPDPESLMAAVDVVDICLPSDLHASHAVAAALRGRDVICEKPIATTLGDATRVCAAFRTTGRRLLVGHVVRYFPEYASVREGVAAGRIGDIAVVHLGRETFAPNRGAGDWLFDERRSGGILVDLMIHDIDYAQWIAGPIIRVYAQTARVRSTTFDDHAVALITHKNGVLSHLTASWAKERPIFRTRIEISGASGLVSHDSRDSDPVRTTPALDELEGAEVGLPGTAHLATGDDPFTAELRDFLTCLVNGSEPRVTSVDSISALRAALAARESASCGEPVDLGSSK